ncbi:DUF6087 family protein [Streptomyces sp. NPDC059564]|uniref:DUF6087 family protein n=1 Tax=Streptomyces sp. NPDC059564 TaxID=3346865 RepID=UPI00369DC0D0
MTDEPLERWAARRQGRLRKPGERKAVTLGTGPQRANHVDPEAPRMILEWDGFAWQPLMPVANYAAACRVLNSPSGDWSVEEVETTGPVVGRNPLAPGTGRHRKPPP